MSQPATVTEVLDRVASGAPGAAERLFALVYDELRSIAGLHMRRERGDHTLQATALVHEAFLKMVDQTRCRFDGRAHFLAAASQAMRRILVDHARGKAREKRGGAWQKVGLEEALTVGSEEGSTTLLALDQALHKLEDAEPEAARVVELRFFGGLTADECAAALAISPRTAARQWAYAKAWLFREIHLGPGPAPPG